MQKKYCMLTFDIEEWFQVENFKNVISHKDWQLKESSVKNNTEKILQILSEYGINSTFFTLGWVAEKSPDLIMSIFSKGHEIASHGYNHDLVNTLNVENIRTDIQKSKLILEDIIGAKIIGYRAPSFSVNDHLIQFLSELGFKYDSSYNPFKLNTRYGSIQKPMEKVNRIFRFETGLYEIPASTLNILSYEFPISGGAYFRLLPLSVFKQLVKYKVNKDYLYNFYLHPWELEPEQPRVSNIPLNYKIRHYVGLTNTENKLRKFIEFLLDQSCEFVTMRDYIEKINQ